MARIGQEVRLARGVHGLTMQAAAHRAGVAWSTESRLEAGDPTVTVATMAAVTEAVGLEIVLRAYPGHEPTLRDTGQLTLAESLVASMHPSIKPTIELAVGPNGQSVDLVAFGAIEIVCIEIERLIVDFQDQYRRAERKREAVGAQHQRPTRLVIAVADTRRNRAAIERHLALIRTALPAGSREVLASLRSGRPVGRDGLIWLRPRRVPPR